MVTAAVHVRAMLQEGCTPPRDVLECQHSTQTAQPSAAREEERVWAPPSPPSLLLAAHPHSLIAKSCLLAVEQHCVCSPACDNCALCGTVFNFQALSLSQDQGGSSCPIAPLEGLHARRRQENGPVCIALPISD
jgi:hypothetical protein